MFCESSAIHMKCQVLFSLKNNNKNRMSSANILFCTLLVLKEISCEILTAYDSFIFNTHILFLFFLFIVICLTRIDEFRIQIVWIQWNIVSKLYISLGYSVIQTVSCSKVKKMQAVHFGNNKTLCILKA